ncbi:MAG TPA: N-acetylmuramidase family protein [Luteitalea sp.]|nr:N-acetylmuramidase family protein [Luteitalea sp.]
MDDITAERWASLAAALAVEEAVLRAVADVESGGSGFLATPPPRPKVLFEGHYFHRLTGGRFGSSHPTLSYPRWTRAHYAPTGPGEWARLDAAIALDRSAALQSASWGAFQIMGANFGDCRCDDVEAFVEMQAGTESQLECFTRFIDRDTFLLPLRAHDWATFASRYNGPAYAKNQYDVKLASAYARHATPVAAPKAVARRGPMAPSTYVRPPGRPQIAAWSASVQRLWRRNRPTPSPP